MVMKTDGVEHQGFKREGGFPDLEGYSICKKNKLTDSYCKILIKVTENMFQCQFLFNKM